VIIDLPQAVDAARNHHAQWMLQRDVDSITSYYAQYAPELLDTQYAKEMWALYEGGELRPETPLTGQFEDTSPDADVEMILDVIQDAMEEEYERQRRQREAHESD
jgi:RIO kinase 1